MMMLRPPNQRYLTFYLDRHLFALEARLIREIVELSPADISMNRLSAQLIVRGQRIPTIDLRSHLGLAPRDLSKHNRSIVVRGRDGQRAILVDAIHKVADRPPPQTDALFTVLTSSPGKGEGLVFMNILDCLAASPPVAAQAFSEVSSLVQNRAS